MQIIYDTGFEVEKFISSEGGNIPEGWSFDWVPGDKPGPVRPEIQPELESRNDQGIHSGTVGVKMAHAYSFFDGVLWKRFAAIPDALYEARIWVTAESDGGLACQIGIDPFGGTDFQGAGVQWSEWWGTDDDGFKSYEWRQRAVNAVAMDSWITVYLRCACRDAVQVNAGFFDDLQVLADAPDEPPKPPVEGTLGDLLGAIEDAVSAAVEYVDQNAVQALIV